MIRNRWSHAWAVLLILALLAPASAEDCGCGNCGSPAVSRSAPIVSPRHAVSITLPSGWSQVPARGPDDFADLRFATLDGRITGFYQVYEGAVTDDATTWYGTARASYRRTITGAERLDFSDLGPSVLGDQKAWSFGFVVVFKQGPPVATRIVFVPRRVGERIDVHEVVITGTAEAMAGADREIQGLLESVKIQY